MILNPTEFNHIYSLYVKGEDALQDLIVCLTPLAEVTASSYSNDDNFRHDLINDCLEHAVKIMRSYDPKRANPYNYFTTVFRNVCITKIQKYTTPFNLSLEIADICVTDNGDDLVYDGDILLLLVERNRIRFPSIPTEQLDMVTHHIYAYITNGSRPGYGNGIIKDIPSNIILNRNVVMLIYYSSLSWLRFINIGATYWEYDMPGEMSLLYDLLTYVGEDIYELLSTVFDGMKLAFVSN